MNKNINSIKLIASFTLGLTLITNSAVMAVYTPGVQKPVPKDRRSEAGTTRGCSGTGRPLTVLAPQNYYGQTLSAHPTLAWFVPRDSAAKPIEFTIYEWVLGGKPKAVRKKSLQSSPGVMKFSPFLENEPGLQPGKAYLWQVVIHCDLDNPSSDLVSEARFEVVGKPTTILQSKLNKAVNSSEKANIYAEAGFWYDALGEALKSAQAAKLGAVGSTLVYDLAKSEAIATTPQARGETEKMQENLQQIARSAQ